MFSGRWVCHAIADGNLSGNPGGSLLVVPGYAGIFPAYVVECCTGVEQTFDLVVGDAEGRSGVRDAVKADTAGAELGVGACTQRSSSPGRATGRAARHDPRSSAPLHLRRPRPPLLPATPTWSSVVVGDSGRSSPRRGRCRLCRRRVGSP